MTKKFISKSSINISAPASSVWDALINPEIITKYFFGAEVISDWQEGCPITFKGEWNGNKYEEKGIILQIQPNKVLQYTHWSNLEGLPDLPEHYRTWTFTLSEEGDGVQLFVSEDNIPTEKQKVRSDEFWTGVLSNIKEILET
jgi:uncharacterized protein YndB with AHSA1/START domain